MPDALRYPRSTYYSYPGGLPSGVKWLLIANCGIFVLEYFATRTGYGYIFNDFGLWPRAVLTLPAIWQLVTYMFLHDPNGLWHILFNMLALWMIGSDLERDWGTRQFLKYYFLCGIAAGACVVLANLAFGDINSVTIGSSGAIYGLLLAYGLLYPDRIILFSFLFPIKAKYFVMILGAIAFLGSFGGTGGGVSHVAHLGGMIFGFFYLRRGRRGRRSLDHAVQSLGRQYHAWRMQRAKRKFELYRRRQDSKRSGPWVN